MTGLAAETAMFSSTTRASARRRRVARIGRAFSLVELMVTILIVATLAALLLPTANRAFQSALSTRCQSNLRQIGMAMTAYQAEHFGALPKAYDAATTFWWYHQLMGLAPGSDGGPYLTSPSVLVCPLKKTGAYALVIKPPTIVGYGMLDAMLWYPTTHRQQTESRMMLKMRNPSDWPLVMDADYPAIYGLDNPTANADRDSRFTARHLSMANVLMADGHIEQVIYGDTRWHQKVLNDDNHLSK